MTPDEKKYFRETREKYFHCTLEQLAGDPEDAWNNIGKGLLPVKKVLESTHTSLEPKVCIQPYRNLLKISMANNIVPLSSGSVGCCANCVPSSFTQAER